eukprot:TRINITY_DN22958_c1_g4_i1.p1 TRINITY_DN22958_c1_g4~~TRINITY_DN22958_c1_g4_i1.p1  ORF type:complete len:910 (-),score=203.84 TRINITY_DN22958_c1_g4_i1:78-2807(-)
MDQLIPIINQLRDALAGADTEFDVELPQIAVVGGQSAGKSSLLEALVGRAFLPTGRGVVTRRPLVLRLSTVRSRSEAPGDAAAEWGEFQHLPGRRFEDFDAIRAEIERDTARVCGSQQGVSHEAIVLKISSPKVVDLTVIDLPGMTRVPVGDQPEDIELKIRELILSYVTRPNCLVLAVVPANADLATSDALAIAREVDPQGQRTIGVVTKLDLMDAGSDSLAVLEGRVYPLRLGYVGVVCRSFSDVQSGKHMDDHLEAEARFFRGHPAYRSLAPRCGTGYLARHLNSILLDHIRSVLPDIKTHVLTRAHELEVELEGYGESVSLQRGDQGAILLSIFTKFANRFGDVIDGKISGRKELHPGELVGRSRIDFIFRDVFARTLQEFDACSGLADDEIRVAIRNATGPRATLFVPEAAFELLVRKQISRLQAPSLQCAELVFEELQQVLLLSALPEFKRFVNLRDAVFGVAREVLQKCLEPTLQMIKDLVSIELAYINTNHPDFVGGTGAMRDALPAKERSSNQLSTPGTSFRQPLGGASGAGTTASVRSAVGTPRAGGGGSATSTAAAETAPVEASSNCAGSTPAGGGGFFGFFRPAARPRQSSTEATAAAEAQPPASSPEPPTGAVAPPPTAAVRASTAYAAQVPGPGDGAAMSPQLLSASGVPFARAASESQLPTWGGRWLCGATPLGDSMGVGGEVSRAGGSSLALAANPGGSATAVATDAANAAASAQDRRGYSGNSVGEPGAFGTGATFAGAFAGGAVGGASRVLGTSTQAASGGYASVTGATSGSGMRLPHVPPVISPAATAPSQRERVEVSIIKMLLESYLAIVKKNMADSVPKAVMHYMVNALKDVIQSECVAKLYREQKFEELLQEAHDVQSRRKRCQERLEAVRRAIEVLSHVGDRPEGW